MILKLLIVLILKLKNTIHIIIRDFNPLKSSKHNFNVLSFYKRILKK